MVKFYRGLSGKFDPSTHKDGLYFATDKGEIYLNGSVYGSEYIVTDVKLGGDGSSLIVSYREQEDKVIDLKEFGKVQGVAVMDKVLSMTDSLISADISMTYNEVDRKIRLLGKADSDGNPYVLGEISTDPFIKDGMLSTVDIVKNPDGRTGTFIEMVFNTDSGVTEPQYVDVTDIFTPYTAGNGIEITNNTIGIKVYTSDEYLTVDEQGIKTKGIKEAFEAIKVKDVDTTPSCGVKLLVEDNKAKVEVSAEELANSLIGSDSVGPVSGITIKLGQAITDGSEEANEIISATASVQSAIQTLAGQIQTAVSGGVSAIEGGEYIKVGGSATAKTLTLDVAKVGNYLVDNSSALKVDAETGKFSLEWEEE